MAVLIEKTQKYEVDTQDQAQRLIESAIEDATGDLSFTRTAKHKKVKGEIVDSWFEVKITEKYTENKR